MKRGVLISAFVGTLIALSVAAVYVSPGGDSRSTPITSNADLYVGPGGTNAGNCQVQATPCATLNYALGQLPKVIKSGVVVHMLGAPDGGIADYYVPAGTPSDDLVDGANSISGFTIDNNAGAIGNAQAYLHIEGSWAQVIAPVTATSGSAFVFDPFAAATVVRAAAGWTPHAFKGEYIEILSGADSMESLTPAQARWRMRANMGVITDNTATQISYIPTVDAFAIVPKSGTSFRVIQPAVNLWASQLAAPATNVANAIVHADNPTGPVTSINEVAPIALRYVVLKSTDTDGVTGILHTAGAFYPQLVSGSAGISAFAENQSSGSPTVIGMDTCWAFGANFGIGYAANGNANGYIEFSFLEGNTANGILTINGAGNNLTVDFDEIVAEGGNSPYLVNMIGQSTLNLSYSFATSVNSGVHAAQGALILPFAVSGTCTNGFGWYARQSALINIDTDSTLTGAAGDGTVDGTTAKTYSQLRSGVQNTTEFSRIWE
jgi:hypothetical protein